jgi:hypothetical protein
LPNKHPSPAPATPSRNPSNAEIDALPTNDLPSPPINQPDDPEIADQSRLGVQALLAALHAHAGAVFDLCACAVLDANTSPAGQPRAKGLAVRLSDGAVRRARLAVHAPALVDRSAHLSIRAEPGYRRVYCPSRDTFAIDVPRGVRTCAPAARDAAAEDAAAAKGKGKATVVPEWSTSPRAESPRFWREMNLMVASLPLGLLPPATWVRDTGAASGWRQQSAQ